MASAATSSNLPNGAVLVGTCTDPTQTLCRDLLSLYKTLKNITKSDKITCRPSGRMIIVTTSNKEETSRLLKTREVHGKAVSFTPHRSLNYIEGAVYLPDDQSSDLNPDELKTQGVVSHFIFTNADGFRKAVLRFETPSLPDHVTLNDSYLKVRPYFPKPIRCVWCQRFGHRKKECRSKVPRCPYCARSHILDDCEARKACCANCGDDHPASCDSCEVWQHEVRVLRVARENRVTTTEARDILKGKKPPPLPQPQNPRPLPGTVTDGRAYSTVTGNSRPASRSKAGPPAPAPPLPTREYPALPPPRAPAPAHPPVPPRPTPAPRRVSNPSPPPAAPPSTTPPPQPTTPPSSAESCPGTSTQLEAGSQPRSSTQGERSQTLESGNRTARHGRTRTRGKRSRAEARMAVDRAQPGPIRPLMAPFPLRRDPGPFPGPGWPDNLPFLLPNLPPLPFSLWPYGPPDPYYGYSGVYPTPPYNPPEPEAEEGARPGGRAAAGGAGQGAGTGEAMADPVSAPGGASSAGGVVDRGVGPETAPAQQTHQAAKATCEAGCQTGPPSSRQTRPETREAGTQTDLEMTPPPPTRVELGIQTSPHSPSSVDNLFFTSKFAQSFKLPSPGSEDFPSSDQTNTTVSDKSEHDSDPAGDGSDKSNDTTPNPSETETDSSGTQSEESPELVDISDEQNSNPQPPKPSPLKAKKNPRLPTSDSPAITRRYLRVVELANNPPTPKARPRVDRLTAPK